MAELWRTGRQATPMVATTGKIAITVSLYLALGALPIVHQGFVVEFEIVLVTLASILFGVPGSFGAGIGTLATSAVQGPIAPYDVFRGTSYLFVGYITASLWQSRGVVSLIETEHLCSRWRYFPVAMVVTAIAAALLAVIGGWIQEMTRHSTFAASVWIQSSDVFSASIVVPTAVVLSYSLLDRYELDIGRHPGENRTGVAFSSRGVGATAVVVLAWLIGGIGISLLYHAFGIVTEGYFNARGLDLLLVLKREALFGPGGVRLQALFGAVMFGLLCALLVRFRIESGTGTRKTDAAAIQYRGGDG